MSTSEVIRTELWRREQLRRAGFSPYAAVLLAESDADYRDAARVRMAGCPEGVALRIFAPIDRGRDS